MLHQIFLGVDKNKFSLYLSRLNRNRGRHSCSKKMHKKYHYVLLDAFLDAELHLKVKFIKIDYYSSNTEEALEIINNANGIFPHLYPEAFMPQN